MRSFLFPLLVASVASAQYVLKSMSFGHERGISPNKYAIPGWHISGDGHTPQLLSDKVILTPPYPGNRRGALWTDTRVSHSEWTADFEFRAGGQEHGGGNLQVWYTREGSAEIGQSSVYTVGKFDGMVLVIDMHGGRGGGIRGFLNDGSTDYKNHHHIDSLAFGHCDYSYRNLGRPSRIEIKQDPIGFEVNVDEKRCFRSDKVKLPSDNYFGITAASSDTPDSFEIFKFVLKTSNSYTREEPRRQTNPLPVQNQNQGSQQQENQQVTNEQMKEPPASSVKNQDAQLADLNNRLQTMSHSMDNLFREVAKSAGLAQERHNEVQQKIQQSSPQLNAVEERLRKIEDALSKFREEFNSKDYSRQFMDIHKSMEARHANLLDRLPDTVGHIISTRSPRVGFFIFLLVVFQLLLAGAYVVYKRRRANAPKNGAHDHKDCKNWNEESAGIGNSEMVLFKRKPVQYVARPPLYEDQEIWPIEETDEIFTNYDDYLARMDFYNQKRFICEITGHSGLDFFDALRNEMEASNEVDDAFPDSLREPILRKVQFSTISRIDNLVDHVFEEFKQDFYPGESVTVILSNGDRLNGIVREKTKFPGLVQADGAVEHRAFARYFVSLTSRTDEEALVDEEHIVRDRKAFTKQMLRSFLKNTVAREAWTGAPWLVKSKLANEYRINTEIPYHLRYEQQVALRKTNLTLKKGDYYDGTNGIIPSFFAPQNRLPELKPKSHKSKNSQFNQFQRALANDPAFGFARGMLPMDEAQSIQFVNQTPNFPPIASRGQPKPPPMPPVKYPIEDLEVPLLPGTLHRPEMKYLAQDPPLPQKPSEGVGSGILMESVGPLLETWNTLNVYCEVYLLDSFTFDDYIEALQFKPDDIQCELLAEIHCAVLKKLVNDEKDLNGQVQVTLPVAPQEDSDGDEATHDRSTLLTPTPEPIPEPEIMTRTTRSSMAKNEAAEIKASAAVDTKLHRAAEIDQSIRGYGWRFRLRKRDFKDGRWVVIIVGLLNLLAVNERHRLKYEPKYDQKCDRILAKLAPLNMEPTEQVAISRYASLDINLRVQILQVICMLSLETQAIRGYMEDCTFQMTQFRKEKIEQQRTRKAAMEELRVLHEERKVLQPEDTSPVPELEELEALEAEIKTDEVEEDEAVVVDSEDEEPIRGRSLRRANDRALERKKKLGAERERKEKAEAEKAKKPTKQARQLDKVLKKIEEMKVKIKECEDEVATLDNDLRENDCPRTRVLGKDRFWNRYYWMERNAMPYAGLPTSSTAGAGYANACIWVQGPDDLERRGFIELSEVENERYRQEFQMGVPQRKMYEEGLTHVFMAWQWGYYDDPDEVDKLIAWLDVRGVREIKLRKELQAQREKICAHMQKRKEYLAGSEDRKFESGEPVVRISTRTKTYVDPTGHRCLAWRNTTALNELGYIHSNPAPRKTMNAKGVAKKAVVVEEEGRQTRASNRGGKPLTRQGSRYEF